MGGRDELERAQTITSSSQGELTTDAIVANLPGVDPEHYELLGEVARGGVGRIIRARDLRLNRLVAIKRLHEPDKNQARFIREALLTARLQHPAIIPVHEVGRLPSGESFFAMKLVEGASLRDVIAQRRTLEERLALLPNVLAVADAIAYAHNQGVIHRDLKPANVLLGAFGETVVIDWGLAKDLKSGDEPLADPAATSTPGAVDETRSGAVLGTPAYMAPEQAMGMPATERTDVYALGALLYHVISGAPPFTGRSAGEALSSVLAEGPIPVGERVRGVPPDLGAIVARAMARDPAHRHADARAFAEELRRFQLGQIAALNDGSAGYDAQLEAEFDAEARKRSLRPVRTICTLAVALNPVFALSENHILPHRQPSMLAVRGGVELIIGLLLAATWTRLGRRFSRDIGLAVLVLLGAMMIALNRLGDGQLQVGFTGSIMMVFLAFLMFPQMPSRKALWALCTIMGLHLVVAVTSKTIPRSVIEQQTTLFICGIVLATISVRFSYRVQRAEFLARRRLEQANQRLARFEK